MPAQGLPKKTGIAVYKESGEALTVRQDGLELGRVRFSTDEGKVGARFDWSISGRGSGEVKTDIQEAIVSGLRSLRDEVSERLAQLNEAIEEVRHATWGQCVPSMDVSRGTGVGEANEGETEGRSDCGGAREESALGLRKDQKGAREA